MKRILSIALALMMFALPVLAEPTPTQEPALIEDPEYCLEVAEGAKELLTLFSRTMGDASFDGAPDAALAWSVLSAYIRDTVPDGQVVLTEDLNARYAELFAQGTFEAIEADISAVKDGQFTVHSAQAPEYDLAFSSAEPYTDDSLLAKFTAWIAPDNNVNAIVGNFSVQLVPAPQSPFGAQIASWEPLAMPTFDSVEASATLSPQEGNTYDAANVVDGAMETCWAYSASTATEPVTLTFSADELQTVRGLLITPGYAKSAYAFSSNRRIKSFNATVAGRSVGFEISDDPTTDDYLETFVLSFDEELVGTEVTIEILETYDGTHFGDVCISEIVLF